MNERKPKDIKRKTVAFNIADPHQKKLHDYCLQSTNFSAFMKMIIQREMDKAQ